MEYGIIFCSYSPFSKSIQNKNNIPITIGFPTCVSYKPLFKKLDILTLLSKYIFSLIVFLVNNLIYCAFKSPINEINARKIIKLFKPTNCLFYHRGVYYGSRKKFNVPTFITNQVMNRKCFEY
jgi:hypothetical protein